ncbi:hypothetical protein DFS33DRAFT_1270257 [Desarmillaria ectypa]|nr:hypothetical protein DFS33DRAFT_1270257 [Desarmillaria ectypa]
MIIAIRIQGAKDAFPVFPRLQIGDIHGLNCSGIKAKQAFNFEHHIWDCSNISLDAIGSPQWTVRLGFELWDSMRLRRASPTLQFPGLLKSAAQARTPPLNQFSVIWANGRTGKLSGRATEGAVRGKGTKWDPQKENHVHAGESIVEGGKPVVQVRRLLNIIVYSNDHLNLPSCTNVEHSQPKMERRKNEERKDVRVQARIWIDKETEYHTKESAGSTGNDLNGVDVLLIFHDEGYPSLQADVSATSTSRLDKSVLAKHAISNGSSSRQTNITRSIQGYSNPFQIGLDRQTADLDMEATIVDRSIRALSD